MTKNRKLEIANSKNGMCPYFNFKKTGFKTLSSKKEANGTTPERNVKVRGPWHDPGYHRTQAGGRGFAGERGAIAIET